MLRCLVREENEVARAVGDLWGLTFLWQVFDNSVNTPHDLLIHLFRWNKSDLGRGKADMAAPMSE